MPSTLHALPDAASPIAASSLEIYEALAELSASPTQWRQLAVKLTAEADALVERECPDGPITCRRDRATDCLFRAAHIELVEILAARDAASWAGDEATVFAIDLKLGRVAS